MPVLTFLSVPEIEAKPQTVQLGLFDQAPAENNGKASAYLSDLDRATVNPDTARLISTIRTTDRLDHDSIVMIAARTKGGTRFIYKLYSNVAEIKPSKRWMFGTALSSELKILSEKLRGFGHDYRYEGDRTLEPAFALRTDREHPFTELKPQYIRGTLVIHNDKAGHIEEPIGGTAKFTAFEDQHHLHFFKMYIDVRDRFLELTEREEQLLQPLPGLRAAMNQAYDVFEDQFGTMNISANRNRILQDTAFGFQMISALERKNGDQWVKADIFSEPIFEQVKEMVDANPIDALARCLNDRGKVDLEYMMELTGITEEELLTQLEHRLLFNPGSSQWETRDHYLSGNVVRKLSIAETAAKAFPENAQLARSYAAIKEVQPEKIPFELLDFNLGERWIPISYYRDFASELFDLPTEIEYFRSLDTFKVSYKEGNATTDGEYVIQPRSGNKMNAHTLLEHALENTTPHFTYEVEKGEETVRVPDNEAIQLAHQKIEFIRNRFLDWLNARPDTEKKVLEELYNKTFNCFVLREYDGSHQLFPGLDKKALKIDELYTSQKNAIWRIVQNRGALIDHKVGLGKTLTMIVASYEMKRLGIVSKPVILALKANVPEIAATYRKAYPDAKVLAPDPSDFSPAKRVQLMFAMAFNNWDCIVMTHEQFFKIPQSPEIQQEIYSQELENVEKDLDTATELGGTISKKMLKGLEIRKNNLNRKLAAIAEAIKLQKDDGLHFQGIGIDHLFVDESHKFKNLTFTTRHTRVAGLGNPEGSQRALNLLFAVRTLQAKFDADLCVTFLSGTPISNSLTEMYLIFKYLRPRELERQQISNFDAWAAVFAKKTIDFEFSVTNQIIAKERFRHFIKVPELALFYNEIADYKTAKHINLDKPELDEQLVNLKPTEDQQDFIKRLVQFAQTGDGTLIGRGELTEEEDNARMLIATNYAKKMAVDMRLIDEYSYDDHPGNKISVSARKIAEMYRISDEYKGTQIVFCDIGTPKPNEFNIYDALKNKLVDEYDIPRHEISFIHDSGWANMKTKPQMFKKMNDGDIRILIGSTEKAGTALNVQERIVALHDLDIPWRPSDLEQRDGRGARQGNRIAKHFFRNKVKKFIYAVEQSLDNYKFNLLKNKQTFISQMKNNELNVRSIDEGSIDEKSGMNFSEYSAILTGNTSLLEKSRLEKKLAVLDNLRTAHYKGVAKNRELTEALQIRTGEITTMLEKLIVDVEHNNKVVKHDADGARLNPIHIDGLETADPETIGRHIIRMYKTWKPEFEGSSEKRIGNLYGYDLLIRQVQEAYRDGWDISYVNKNLLTAESSRTGIRYQYNSGHPNVDNPKLAARYFLNALERSNPLKEKYEKERLTVEEQLTVATALSSKPFEKEEEMKQMKAELSRLEQEITQKIRESQDNPETVMTEDIQIISEKDTAQTANIIMPTVEVEVVASRIHR